MTSIIEKNKRKLIGNQRQQQKTSGKRRVALSMASDIQHFLSDEGINLPRKKEDLKHPDFMSNPLVDEYRNLINFKYALTNSNLSLFSIHTNGQGQYAPQLISHIYNKNRLDPVWNYRKSQIVRSTWARYLQETQVHKDYTPIHLMLSVPHPDGKFMGLEFYYKKLKELFNRLRKTRSWKECIWGGEYGVETTRGKNGLHIHFHCLLFQYKTERNMVRRAYTYINKHGKMATGYRKELIDTGQLLKTYQVRKRLHNEWKKLVDPDNKYKHIQLWYETLYVYRKKPNGEYYKNIVKRVDEYGETFYKEVKRKYYLDEEFLYYMEPTFGGRYQKVCTDIPVNAEIKLGEKSHMLDGVMECIKYHFKQDACKKDGKWDVDLINTILNETKHDRLYDRIGALYGEKRLSFNHDPELESEQTAVNRAYYHMSKWRKLIEKGEVDETDPEIQKILLKHTVNYQRAKIAKGDKKKQVEDELAATNSDRAVERLVNPWQLDSEEVGEYRLATAHSNKIRYLGKDEDYRPIIYNRGVFYFQVPGLTPKQIIKNICTRRN